MAKNTSAFVFLVIVLLIVGGVLYSNLSKQDPINTISSANAKTSVDEKNVQNIVLSEKDYDYYPRTVKVKVNQPVRISLDSSVTGCLRSFVIKEFGVSKYLRTPQESVTFTPTKTGSFEFACSMRMGTGTLIVEN